MQYTKLSHSGIEVSRLCLGGMSFGEPDPGFHQWTIGEDETREVIGRAWELGVNFIDTANCYAKGTSELFIGRALRDLGIPRDKVVLASKVYFNEGRLSREAINREIDGTLERLGTDYLDLYIIHRFDYDTPIEETLEALDGQGARGQGARSGGERDVRLPAPLHAGVRRAKRLDEIHQHAVPLQPALSRRRARDDSRMPPVRHGAHAL